MHTHATVLMKYSERMRSRATHSYKAIRSYTRLACFATTTTTKAHFYQKIAFQKWFKREADFPALIYAIYTRTDTELFGL